MAKHSRTPDSLQMDDSLFEEETSAPSAPTVVYPDGSGLARPLTIPKRLWAVVGLIAVAALVIGGLVAFRSLDSVVNYRAHQQELMADVLARPVDQDVLHIVNYAGLDSDQVRDVLAEYGYKTIDVRTLSDANSNAIDLVKYSPDMEEPDALAVLNQGVQKVSPTLAAQYLTGSWRLTQKNPGTLDKAVHYADFNVKNPAEAVEAAIAYQGFDPASVTDEGVDAQGNTYKIGTVSDGETTFVWSVNACPYSEVYEVEGLPPTVQYVGVRIYTNN